MGLSRLWHAIGTPSLAQTKSSASTARWHSSDRGRDEVIQVVRDKADPGPL